MQLAKEAGINYRAIYKNTTIDPPGTIKHVEEMGAEIIRPNTTFGKLIQRSGFPNRMQRFCCYELKEYKVLDKAIHGVRRCESTKRSKMYTEPTQCRYYGKKTPENHVEVLTPILDWTDEDVAEFIMDRGIKCAPVYYDKDGNFNVKERLGCMCCPMLWYKKRQRYFDKYPGMVKLYIRNGEIFLKNHPNTLTAKRYKDVYEWFVRDLFYVTQQEWEDSKKVLFAEDTDYKAFLEKRFNIKL